ncbi:MAG: hypothetical protein AAFV19_16485 [Pseudomonadota bacterium]
MRAQTLSCLATALVLAVGAAGPARAVEDYDTCLTLIGFDPAQAELEAGEWARFGGGAPARHCYALALIENGAPGRAIDELLDIVAEEGLLADQARAEILVQAGELLVEEGDLVTAGVVAAQAISLDGGTPGAAGLRASIRLRQNNPRGALEDLNTALAGGTSNPRLLILRASAYRAIDQFIAARDDAVFATELAPDFAEAWLERGRVEARLRDKRSARDSLLRAIDLDRGGRIGLAAQNALQRMEAGID